MGSLFVLVFLVCLILSRCEKLLLPRDAVDDHWRDDSVGENFPVDDSVGGPPTLSPYAQQYSDDSQYELDDSLPEGGQGNYTTASIPLFTETLNLSMSFIALDSDADGFISQQDVFQWLKRRYDLLDDYFSKKSEVWEVLFTEADTIPKDGVISLAEFCFFFKLNPTGRRLQPSLPVSPFKPPPQNIDGDDDQEQPGVRLVQPSKPALSPTPSQPPSAAPSANFTPQPESELLTQSPALKVAVKVAGVVTGLLTFAALAVITGMSCLSCQSQRMRSYSSIADKSKFSSSLGTTTLHDGVGEGVGEGVILIDVIPAFMPAEVPTPTAETQDNDNSCFISSPSSGCLSKV